MWVALFLWADESSRAVSEVETSHRSYRLCENLVHSITLHQGYPKLLLITSVSPGLYFNVVLPSNQKQNKTKQNIQLTICVLSTQVTHVTYSVYIHIKFIISIQAMTWYILYIYLIYTKSWPGRWKWIIACCLLEWTCGICGIVKRTNKNKQNVASIAKIPFFLFLHLIHILSPKNSYT